MEGIIRNDVSFCICVVFLQNHIAPKKRGTKTEEDGNFLNGILIKS